MDLGSDDDYEGGKAAAAPHARSIRVDSLTANLSPGGTKTFDLNLSAHGGGFGDDLDTGAFKQDSADLGAEVAQLAGEPSPDRFLPPERKLVQLEFSQPAAAFERSDSGSDWGSDDDEDDHADEASLADSSSTASPGAGGSPARSKDAGQNNSRSKVLPPGQGQKFEGKFDFGEVSAAQQLTRQNAELLAQMDEQKLEMKRMRVAMDAAKPIAGLDPSKFLDVMHGTEMVDQDMRDKKIVELATQKRDLNVKFQAERDRHAATKKALAEAKKEVELMGSPAARAAAAKGAASMGAPAANGGKGGAKAGGGGDAINADAPNNPEADAAQARKECKALRRKVTALKRSVQQGAVELRRTQRALAREVGETVLAATAPKESDRARSNGEGSGAGGGAGAGGGLGLALEKVLEGGDGWKGRAQQIVMLRTKLRRVETERDRAVSTAAALHDAADAAGVDISNAVNAAAGGSPHLAGTKARAAAAAARNRRERSVDTQAQAALDDMEAQRREAVEAVTAQNEHLTAQLGATNRKHDAARARVRVLEGTSKKQQAQLKTLLSKSKMDDELVEAQKKQLKLLAKQLHQAKLAALGDATSPPKPGVLASLASVVGPGSIASMASMRSSRSDATLLSVPAGAVPTPAQMQVQQAELKQERQERERLVAQNRDQGKRLERQEQVMSTLRREISSLRDRLALPEHTRPRRPDSRETRERARQAGAQLEAEAVLARGKADEIEIARLRELSGALNTKLDASEAKVRELEAQRGGRRRRVPAASSEGEGGTTKNRSPQQRRGAENGGSEEVEKLRQQLARALDENEAMRQSYHTSLSAMERELQLTKKASAEQRAEFDDTVARMRDHVQRSVVQATEHGVLSAFDAGSRENMVRGHTHGKQGKGASQSQAQAKMASTRT